MSGKTEQPTARRLRQARERGDSAVSLPLAQAAGFVAALALMPGAFVAAAARLGERVRWSIESAGTPLPAEQMAQDVLVLSAPVLFAAALTGAVVSFVQTGGVLAWTKVSPDLSRANPFTGIKNLFSWQRVASVVRALLTALVVGAVCVDLLLDHAASLVGSTGSIAAGAAVALDVATSLAWIAALIGLGFAAVDLLLTRIAWIKRLMMTRDEVRRELRETEGDPEIKQARRHAHHALLTGATLNAIRDASVLIVNPTHLATALRYSSTEDDAPRVIAQGKGELARRMIDAARAYGVPVVRDVPVARALQELEIGDQIPETLYEAVAEILREVWEEGGT